MESTAAAPPSSDTTTILLVSNRAWNLANFRRPIIESFLAEGYRVVCAGGRDGHEDALRDLGAEFVPLPVDAAGRSPLADARLLLALIALLRRDRPSALLTFTIKPNIYGLLAARACAIPAIPTISGLGSSFLGGGLTGAIAARLYRVALAHAKSVVFQNADDRDLFAGRGLVDREACRLVPGSGIDLGHFRPAPIETAGQVRFLLIGRLLRDKGLEEYVAAARLLRSQGARARFALLGPDGGNNPTAVPMTDVERWDADGTIDYLGASDDVRPHIAAAHCVVLPSYREGLPRSLLEGAAMARPLIATDVPGCRDVVDNGVNGLLCAPRSAADLARAMGEMLGLDDAARGAMGRAGRRMAEKLYDQRLVAAAYLEEVAR